MGKLILHIGQAKTGTTSLQRTFLSTRTTMASRGVLYPFLHRSLDRHTALLPYLIDQPVVPGDVAFLDHFPGDGVMGKSAAMWHDTLRQVHDAQPDLTLLSGEGFFILSHPQHLKNLTAKLHAQFDDIAVVAYLRSPHQRFLSTLQQGLKMGGHRPKVDLTPYRPSLQNYANFGPGPLNLHVFDRQNMVGQDVVTDFTQQYCPQVMGIVAGHEARDLNTSISAEAMAVFEHYTHLVDRLDVEAQRLKWTPVRNVVTRLDQSLPGFTRPRLTDAARELIQRRTMDLTWLRDHHGIWFRDVDYSIAGSDPDPNELHLKVAETCVIDTARLRAMMRATQRALEFARIVPTGFLRRLHRGFSHQLLTKKPR